VYALGIILYECLAGRVPFEGDTFMGILTQHLTADAPAIDQVNPHAKVTQELELVIRKALAKSPDDRYQDTEELAEAIVCALDGRVSRATRRTPASVLGGPLTSELDTVPKRKTSAWVWVAAVIGAAGFLVWSALGSRSGPGSEAEASAVPFEPPQQPVAEATDVVEEAPPIPEAEPEPMWVDVHVASDPTGARVSYDGGAKACASTPCTLEVTRGATLVLHAKLGKRRGRTAITPSQEETVLIELHAPKRPMPKPRSAQVPKRKREAPARSSDLKVPEWAQ
jgi:serine/threonine-protein kinase